MTAQPPPPLQPQQPEHQLPQPSHSTAASALSSSIRALIVDLRLGDSETAAALEAAGEWFDEQGYADASEIREVHAETELVARLRLKPGKAKLMRQRLAQHLPAGQPAAGSGVALADLTNLGRSVRARHGSRQTTLRCRWGCPCCPCSAPPSVRVPPPVSISDELPSRSGICATLPEPSPNWRSLAAAYEAAQGRLLDDANA